jgi:phage minor structural protein
MAFSARLNDETFFSTALDLDEYTLTSAQLNNSITDAGTFTFVILPCNAAYSKLYELKSMIDVYRDDTLIWSGRVYSIMEQMDTSLKVVCEGMLAVLNDSVARPFIYNDTVSKLVSAFITSHNEQVEAAKQIAGFNITIDEKDNTIYREFEAYESTMTRLKDLADSYGGYMYITKESGSLRLNWVKALTEQCSQVINFGENLLDITQSVDSADIITVLVPLGAYLEDSEGTRTNNRLTISSVNDNKDYLVAPQEYIDRYGYIYGTNTWDDVNVAAILKTKGQTYLNSKCVGQLTVNVSAVDLKDTGENVESFMCGQTVKVISEPHGLTSDSNTWFEVTSQSLNLLNPAQNKMTLGLTLDGYIQSQLANARKNRSDILGTVSANYATNEAVKSQINEIHNYLTTYESIINQLPDEIKASVIKTITDTYDGRIQTLESDVKLTADQLSLYFGADGKINTWFDFNDEYFAIRKSNKSIISKQTNESLVYEDADGNEILRLDSSGITAKTVNVSGQLEIMNGSTAQWAIRKGAIINGKANLDDVWIGG